MNTRPSAIYFLMRYSSANSPGGRGFTAYGAGSNIFGIANIHQYQIVRYYPSPSLNLTPRLISFQRLWRRYRLIRRWCAHPLRIQYRTLHGRFPPIPAAMRKGINMTAYAFLL